MVRRMSFRDLNKLEAVIVAVTSFIVTMVVLQRVRPMVAELVGGNNVSVVYASALVVVSAGLIYLLRRESRRAA